MSKTLIVVCSCMLLCGNAVSALSGSDNFNDNSRDTGKWSVPFNNALSETNNRVEYITPGINPDDSGMWLWTPNAGSCTQDWYVTIEAHNSSTPTNHDQHATFELAVFKDWGKSFWVGLAAYGSEGETGRYIDTGWNIGDTDIETLAPIGSDSATLRISYDSIAKSLSSQYDLGDGFIVATNFNTDNWELEDTDSLNVWIVGFSDKLSISSGQIYADNFQAVTLPNRAAITNFYPVATGFMLEWIPVAGFSSVVNYTPNLTNSFSPLSATLPYPANSYIDTLHGDGDKCFYRVDLEP